MFVNKGSKINDILIHFTFLKLVASAAVTPLPESRHLSKCDVAMYCEQGNSATANSLDLIFQSSLWV
jgi:hypothetical protein